MLILSEINLIEIEKQFSSRLSIVDENICSLDIINFNLFDSKPVRVPELD